MLLTSKKKYTFNEISNNIITDSGGNRISFTLNSKSIILIKDKQKYIDTELKK